MARQKANEARNEKEVGVDRPPSDVLEPSQRQTVLSRLYGHRSTLKGLLNETERMLDWLVKTKS